MTETTNLALIGCGFFARNHLHAWRDLAAEGARLVAVCDVDAARAWAAAEEFGVPRWYQDAATMFDEVAIDLVDIATRMDTHRALVELAVGRGVAAIVQKPFAPAWEDCLAMVRTAREAGVFLAVHENFRFQSPMLKVAELLRSGAIGDPTWARISFRTGYDVYATQPYFYDEERFAILDVGIHVLDIARVLMGEVDHIFCQTQKRNPKVRAEDTATMMLRHTSGAVSVVECTYEARKLPDPFPETLLEIEGPDGTIVVKPGLVMEVTLGGDLTSGHLGTPLLSWSEEQWHVAQESVLTTNRHMLQRFQAGEDADTSGADNLKTYALVEAAYESAATGRAVKPPVETLP
jgi:predicted dehydrogenase